MWDKREPREEPEEKLVRHGSAAETQTRLAWLEAETAALHALADAHERLARARSGVGRPDLRVTHSLSTEEGA